MALRDYLQRLEDNHNLQKISQPVSKTYEIAAVLKQLEPTPVVFESVRESDFRVAGNLFCSKAAFADYFDLPVSQIIPLLTRAIDMRSPCPVVEQAPCQEVVDLQPDLDRLPILRHCEKDGATTSHLAW